MKHRHFSSIGICGVDIAERQIFLGGGEGGVPEKVLECQNAMRVVLQVVAAKTISQAVRVKFRR